MRNIFPKTAYVLLLIMALSVTAFAGNTGFVSGLVTDQNGAAVNGALVVVKGANLFAMTNADGYYVINGVPVGTYTVNASRVGYSEMSVSDVRVMADLRNNVGFTLVAESSGLTTIRAEDPLIDVNITYTGRDIGSESFDTQVADDFQDMLVRTPGIVTEDNAEGTLNLHIRGGRGEEVAYIVDGVNITNPIAGGAGMQVPTDAIEAMNVITAGWDAEYGDAQSGIINITTKEGGEKFTGNVRYTHEVFTATKESNSYEYLESTGLTDPDEPLVTWITRTRQAEFQKINATFGGPLIGKYASFYVGGDWSKDKTVLPLPDPDIRWNASGKITLKPSSKYRITLSGARYRADLDDFENQYQYVLEEHGLDYYIASLRTTAAWAHYISDSAFYTLTFGTFDEHRRVDVNGKFWTDYELVRNQTDPTGWFFTSGDYPYFEDRYQRYYNVKGDFTLDIAKVTEGKTLQQNQIKAGGDVKLYELSFYQIQPFPGNVYTDIYTVEPRSYAAYAQDKLEYSGMIMNIGLRFDMFDPNADYPENPYDYQLTRNGLSQSPDSDYERYEDMPTIHSSISYQLSPRIGISYPITDRDKLHFSYGHFFQTPPYRHLYRSTQVEPDGAYPIIGNPDINPQKTVQYEIGVEHVFSDGLKADVSAYFKDIKDLIDSEMIVLDDGRNYTRIINADFGNVRGLEVLVESNFAKYFSGSLGYTFSIAKGLASSWFQGYNYAYRGWQAPNRENRLDWDQTHTVNAVLDFRSGNFGVNTTVNYGSGMPYSPPSEGSGQPQINTERMPWTIDWNVRANYDIELIGLKYSVFAELINILNRRNVYNFGVDEGDGSNADWTPFYYFYDDPDGPYDDIEVYGDPFRLRVGVSVGF